MLTTSVRDSLQLSLSHASQTNDPPHVAILGIGRGRHGDNAAGCLVARYLQRHLQHDDVLVIDAGIAPENCTGILRPFKPNLVLLVDAGELGYLPGTISWLPFEKITGFGASACAFPLNDLARYLVYELGCYVDLVAIQAGSSAPGYHFSLPARKAVRELASLLCEALIP